MDKSFLFLAPLLALLVFALTVPQTKIGVTLEQLNVSHNVINQVGENRTLFVSGWSTGNFLLNEFDLQIGEEYGAMKIGSDIELSKIDGIGVVGNLNLTDVFLIRNVESGVNNLSLIYATSTQVRLAVPVPGAELAVYNPRSMMVGGKLGQILDDNIVRCGSQGYEFIDCSTDITGADLGVEDDLEVHGKVYLNETLELTNPTLQSGITVYDETLSKVCMQCWSDGVCNATSGAC